MISVGSRLKSADNSGALEVECIRVLGGTRKRYARVGDQIVVSVKKALASGGIKRKSVVTAVVVRQKAPIKRKDGTCIRFDENAVVLINKDKLPLSTRIFGPIAREIKTSGFNKIVSLAPEVI
ncbi:MAG: 50S ribosomal protein L14 [bacterium]